MRASSARTREKVAFFSSAMWACVMLGVLPLMTMRTAIPILTFAALAACAEPPAPASPSAQSSAPAPPPTPPSADDGGTTAPKPAPSAEEPGTPHERLMRHHFVEAAVIRRAVIDGALADAVAPAQALAHNEGLGKLEPGWQSSIDVLEYAAKRIQHSSDIPALAAAVSDIGIACGACHKASSGPRVQLDAPPGSDGSLAGRMRRHVWATERLWDGIYAPSDAAWKAGAAALSGAPFPNEVLDKGDVHARSAATQFRSLVPALASKKTPQERGQAYASLLETCSACHVVTRKR